MAFPAIVTSASTTTGSAPTSPVALSMPSGIVAGDPLLAVIGIRTSQTAPAPTISMSGWSQVGATIAGTNQRIAIFRKTAAGSDTASFVFSGALNSMAAGVYRLSGADFSTSPELASDTTANPPNPPNL